MWDSSLNSVLFLYRISQSALLQSIFNFTENVLAQKVENRMIRSNLKNYKYMKNMEKYLLKIVDNYSKSNVDLFTLRQHSVEKNTVTDHL